MKKILILVPHPDDDVLSFGGLIARAMDNKWEVRVHIFCVGGPASNVPTSIRLQEIIDVQVYWGPKCTYTYDEGLDGILDTVPDSKIVSSIDQMIKEFMPDEVYCGANSEHGDHRKLYECFKQAARLKSGYSPKLFAVGVYPFSDQLYPSPDGGKIYQPLTEVQFNRKLDAFKLYKSQQKPWPSPLGERGVKIKAEYDGMACGSVYAELYYQLRYIRSLNEIK